MAPTPITPEQLRQLAVELGELVAERLPEGVAFTLMLNGGPPPGPGYVHFTHCDRGRQAAHFSALYHLGAAMLRGPQPPISSSAK